MRRVKRQKNSGDVITGRKANFNRRKTRGIEGDHLIQCDITGQVCLRSEARMTWRGLLVSNQNWDPKHPQLTINVPPEDISVRDARPFNSSCEEVGSDVVDTGFVQLTDQDIPLASSATYTLTSTGLVTTSAAGTLSGEWWSQSPNETPTIGNFYQVMVTVVQTTGGTLSGFFDQWVSLSAARTWTLESDNDVGADLFFQIRSILDLEVKATATISLGGIVVPLWTGDFPIICTEISAVESGVNTDFANDIYMAKTTKDRVAVANFDTNTPFTNSGQVHIYTYDGVSWTLEQTIQAPTQQANTFFGSTVALIGDGSRLITAQQSAGGTPQANVFVYDRVGTTWSLAQTITTTYTAGTTTRVVDVSRDGTVLCTSNSSSLGQLQVWRYDGANYQFEATIDAGGGNNNWAQSFAISSDGLVIVGNIANDVEVFEDTTGAGNWVLREQIQTNLPMTGVQKRVYSASADGSIVAFARNSVSGNTVWTYSWDGANYQPITIFQIGFKTGVQLSSNGRVLAVLDSTGAVINMYEGDLLSDYALSQSIQPCSTPVEGNSRAATLSDDGELVVIGNEGWNFSNGQEGRAISQEADTS